MAPPSPAESTPAVAPPGADRGGGFRLAGVLLLAVLVGAGAWWIQGRGGGGTGPAALFDHVRDRTLEGDGGALWRLMLPPAREDYVGFLENVRNENPPEFAATYLKLTGMTKEDLSRLPPDRILSIEQLALAEEMYRGARVFDAEVRGDGAVLHITLRDASERRWFLLRIDGAWKIENLQALLDADGRLLASHGHTVPPAWKEPRR